MQGLGNNEKKVFLGISQGKITYRPGRDAERLTYDFVEGRVKEIVRRDATVNGAPVKFYDFIIENGSDVFALSVPMDGSAARGIILPLTSVKNFSELTIRISPWLKDTYTNVSVYANGQRLNWGVDPKSLPPVKKVKVGSKEYVDDAERVSFIDGLVDAINATIKQSVPESASANSVVDYERNAGVAPAGPEDVPPPSYDDGLFNGGGFNGWDQNDFHPNM